VIRTAGPAHRFARAGSLPTTDGRELVLTRYTEPDTDLRVLLAHMKLRLPQQPPPKIRAPQRDIALAALPV